MALAFARGATHERIDARALVVPTLEALDGNERLPCRLTDHYTREPIAARAAAVAVVVRAPAHASPDTVGRGGASMRASTSCVELSRITPDSAP